MRSSVGFLDREKVCLVVKLVNVRQERERKVITMKSIEVELGDE